MKGLATQTIVLLILALIVLGILGGLIFIGGGPFRASAEYNACKGRLVQWCTSGGEYQSVMGESCLDNAKWARLGYRGFHISSGKVGEGCNPDSQECCP